jgi:hypothetical protein
MPIYDPYKEVVQPAKYVAPMDLNLLLKGTQYKQEQSEKNFNEIQGQVNNLLSIPAYGKDKEILNQKLQELQQVMGGLDVTNLETPQAKQQINSLINQFSQDKDVQAIANRGYSYQNMLNEKKDLEKKGNRYINYGLDDLNEYYSGDNYIRDYKFSNNGYLGADVGKIMEDIKKTMTPTKTTKTLSNGEVITEEKYDTDVLLENTKLQLQNSNWEREIKDRTQRKYKNENIDDYALQHASELESIASQNLSNAYFIYGDPSSTKEQREKAVADIYKSQKDLATANSIKNNPYHGQAFLLGEIDNEKNKSINQVAEALNYHQESLPKLGEAYKMAEEHKHDFAIQAQESANRIKEEQAKTLALGASSIGKPLDEVLRDPTLMSQALAAGQQAKLAEFDAKENTKLQNKLTLTKKVSSLGIPDTTKDTDNVTFTKAGSSTPTTIQYGELKKILKSGSVDEVKSIAAGIMSQNGLAVSPSDITVTNDGQERKIEVFGSWFDGQPAQNITIDLKNIANFKSTATGATGASGVVNTTKNKKMNIWGKDWTMTTVTHEGKKIQVVSPQTKEEYDNIPSGVKYYDTDGQLKIK